MANVCTRRDFILGKDVKLFEQEYAEGAPLCGSDKRAPAKAYHLSA